LSLFEEQRRATFLAMANPQALSSRALVIQTHDLLAVSVAWLLAFLLRFSIESLSTSWVLLKEAANWLPVVVALYGAVFWFAGLYRGLWRYANLQDVKRIAIAVLIAAILLPATLTLFQWSGVPRTVLVVTPMFAFLFMCASRVLYRMYREGMLWGPSVAELGQPAIVIGAGDACDQLLRELKRSKAWRAVALLDDDQKKFGRLIQDVAVVGNTAQLPAVAQKYRAKTAILALPSAPHQVRGRLAKICADADIAVLTVPSFDEVITGRALTSEVRQIEVEDLLGRDPVELDNDGLNKFLGKRVVLITGAGGSIGSELCMQIARFKPAMLVFVDLSEFLMYQLVESFSRAFPEQRFVSIVGDVRSRQRISQIMNEYRPSVVFHAAAYKHVPLMEELNAWEAVRNNVYGTYVVGRAAIDAGAEKFVLVSTDKAVNPTNVMGATKRMAELVCQGLNNQGKTLFSMVRFGNVLGSNGSVIPKFEEQIRAGGPLTVTHPDIIRYFMSIPEAAQLVLQSGWMGHGGEIFVLDMGEPVKIVDLAKQMIKLYGKTEREIEIEFTGLRPGEKLYEELLADDEQTVRTHHPKVRIARARSFDQAALDDLVTWAQRLEIQPDDVVRRELRRWVPEYQISPPDGNTATRLALVR
jgi:FlaA1/EpsC-like NDP-sugar epimerase